LTLGAIAELNVPHVALLWPVLIGALALVLPNSTVLAHRLRHGRLGTRSHRHAVAVRWWLPATVTGLALYLAISSIGNVQSKFIYFNF
jgi:hypothetical protein